MLWRGYCFRLMICFFADAKVPLNETRVLAKHVFHHKNKMVFERKVIAERHTVAINYFGPDPLLILYKRHSLHLVENNEIASV